MELLRLPYRLKNIIKPGGGFVEEKTEDPRNFKFSEVFANEIFGGSIPETFITNNLPRIPNQWRTLACVPCSFTFVNSWYSKQEGNDVYLSWRDLFSRVPLLAGGTRVSDNLKELYKRGQCENNYLPEKMLLTNTQARDRGSITPQAVDNAKKYRIRGYFSVNGFNKAELKTAIMKAPTPVGVYSNYSQWQKDKIIKYDGWEQWGHYSTIIGWTKDYFINVDSMLNTIVHLDINHPIVSARGIYDLPDNFISKYMKIYKLEQDYSSQASKEETAKIWCVLPNGKRFHILSMPQFRIGEEQGFWKMTDLKIISKEELETYAIEKNPPVFIA